MKERKEPYFTKPLSEEGLRDEGETSVGLTSSYSYKPKAMLPDKTKLVRVNFGIYVISLYLILKFLMWAGDYANSMVAAGKHDLLMTVDLTGSAVSYIQAAVFVNFIVAILFITFAFIRIRRFQIFASLLMLVGSLFVTELEVYSYYQDRDFRNPLGAFSTDLGIRIMSVLGEGSIRESVYISKLLVNAQIELGIIVPYLLFRSRVRRVYG